MVVENTPEVNTIQNDLRKTIWKLLQENLKKKLRDQLSYYDKKKTSTDQSDEKDRWEYTIDTPKKDGW